MDDIYIFYENRTLVLSANRKYIIGRDLKCDIVLNDKHVSRKHASLEYVDRNFLLTDLQSVNGTWVEGKRIDKAVLQSNSSFRIAENNLSIRTMLENSSHGMLASGDTMTFEKKITGIMEKVENSELMVEVAVLRKLYNQKKEKLSELAFYDTLTGLYNRRYFDLKLNEEVIRAIRYRRPLSVLMIDIDHFKKFNDKFGHQKGDTVLAAVAHILSDSLRGSDIICRYGGEEIVVVLPETTGRNAHRIGDNCRKNVENGSPEAAGVVVTVSVGASELVGVDTPETLIESADLALYQAKKRGRNQVVLSEK